MTLEGLWQLRMVMYQCPTPTCSRYHVRYHPEEAGGWALPHGEFGLDVIALIGAWRETEHRSVPEMRLILVFGEPLKTTDLSDMLLPYNVAGGGKECRPHHFFPYQKD